MISLVLVLAIVASACATDYTAEFVSWMIQHKRTYTNSEFQSRFKIFSDNLDFINRHNADTTQKFKTGLNEFADLSHDEFVRTYASGLKSAGLKRTNQPAVDFSTVSAPTSWDWRQHGACTPIKNQGQCGSCWSFSATGSMEGAWFLANHTLVGLSEQNLIDCSTSEGNEGCDGGLMDLAFKYVISNGGIDSEASYPYTAADGNCHYNVKNRAANITSYTDIAHNEAALLVSVSKQPTSIAMDASAVSFQFYTSGVYWSIECSSSSNSLDHGVLAVGYGASDGDNMWIVKNSWGTSWGMDGWFYLYRGDNQCGVADAPSVPVV